MDDLRRQGLPGFGYSPEQPIRNGGSRKSKSGSSGRNPWYKRSKTESQRSADIELQRGVNTRLQGLGNQTEAGTGCSNEWDEGGDAHSRSRIVMTTTLTVRQEGE